MDKFLSGVQSFIHSVTTPDRYASYDSGYNKSSHARRPGTVGNAPSQGLVSSSNDDEGFSQVGIVYSGNASSTSLDHLSDNNGNQSGFANNRPDSSDSRRSSTSSRMPYTPGIRSSQVGNGGVPLQDYANGGPPAPSPAVSWKRIERWMDSNFPELYECLADPATSADLNELENDLDCSLPLEVRDSYQIHDGQEEGGRPTGLIFGIYILGLEEISSEWDIWKTAAIRINEQARLRNAAAHGKQPMAESSTAAQHPQRNAWIDRQASVPDGAIQKVYAHPGWIPLCKDNEGNNIAVDLAPGPKGRWGQVILFGREFDRKYVIAPSWASFLAMFADDLESGNIYIREDLEEAEFWFTTPSGQLLRYLNVLRGRSERKFRPVRRAPPSQGSNKTGSHLLAASGKKKDNSPGSRAGTRPGTPNSGKLIATSPNTSQGVFISPVQSSVNLVATEASAATENKETSSPLRESVSADDEDGEEIKVTTPKEQNDSNNSGKAEESEKPATITNEAITDAKENSSETRNSSTKGNSDDLADVDI